MARVFNVNFPIVANAYSGGLLFQLKEIAVVAGWQVVGSGDGTGGSRFGYIGIASVPVPERGSGGEYDCWQTGDSRLNASVSVAGDAGNRNSWCVLRNGVAEVMLCASNQPTGFANYGRIAFNPGTGAIPTFDGSVASASAIPGLATHEVWFNSGTRAAPDGVILYQSTSGALTAHFFGSTTVGAGGITPFGYVTLINGSPSQASYHFIMSPVTAGTESATDPSPCAAFFNSVPIGSTSMVPGWGWNPLTSSGQSTSATSLFSSVGFWAGSGNVVAGDDPLVSPPVIMVTTPGSRFYKGDVHPDAFAVSAVQRGWGNYGLDSAGRGWAYLGSTGGMLMPWPDTLPAPLP